jgi:C-terminal processing protease CtpA/Prc
MAWTKAKTAMVAGVGVLLVALTVTVTIQQLRERTSSPTGRPASEFPPSATDPVPEIAGVGVMLRVESKTGTFIAEGVLSNSPAAAAGVTKGMIVTRIDDRPTQGMNLKEGVDLIRGAVGTKVRLELMAPDTHATTTVELTRQTIKLPSTINTRTGERPAAP